jgi:hypothetical protein
MNRPVDERQRRLAQLKREVTRREFDRHASVLTNLSELPAEFQSPAVAELAVRETIQKIIVFPPQIWRGGNYVPKQVLLFASTGLVHLMGSIWPDEPPQVTYFNGCGLLYMDITLLLLYGFLEIAAVGQDLPMQLGVEFNTVAWPLLSMPLRKILRAATDAPDNRVIETSYSQTAVKALEELPLKFSNGVKIHGLLPGEHLEELTFQPGSYKRWLYFFRKPITANTLLLLTTSYVVMIREDLIVPQGWILTYIPRECISEIQHQASDLSHEIIFRLKRGKQSAEYRLWLTSESVEAWKWQWLQHRGQWKDLTVQVN